MTIKKMMCVIAASVLGCVGSAWAMHGQVSAPTLRGVPHDAKLTVSFQNNSSNLPTLSGSGGWPLKVSCENSQHYSSAMIQPSNSKNFSSVFYNGALTFDGTCWAYFSSMPTPPSTAKKFAATKNYGTIVVANNTKQYGKPITLCLKMSNGKTAAIAQGSSATYTITGTPSMTSKSQAAIFKMFFTQYNCTGKYITQH